MTSVDRSVDPDAGVVHQHVHAAVALEHLVGDAQGLRRVGEVGDVRARRAQPGQQVAAPRRRGDQRAARDEQARRRGADAARRAGDQADRTGKLHAGDTRPPAGRIAACSVRGMPHTREDLTFDSAGVPLAAWLYRPAAADGDAVPCIVMAHGFSATRRDGLEPYAERFADAGFAVLLFDYRGFGDSGGEPRQVIDIRAQQDDYRAAIRAAARVPWVDAARIALFGSSFSGGHVVTVAAGDAQIAAVISQAPFADGIAQLRNTPPTIAARMTVDGIRDVVGAAAGRPPVTVAAAGPPGSYAVMTAPEAEPGFQAIVGDELALAQRRSRRA